MRRPRLPRLPKSIVGLVEDLRRKEDRLSLVLSLFIGALVGLVVVAFILLTGRLTAHMYPAGGLGWRRILVPVVGSLLSGYLLYRYFPLARGSGIPQTRAAVFIHDGRISLRSVFGKFVACSITLASGMSWPSVGAYPDPVVIRFTAGEWEPDGIVPEGIKQAILLKAADLNTGMSSVGGSGAVKSRSIEGLGSESYDVVGSISRGTSGGAAADMLLNPYRVFS